MRIYCLGDSLTTGYGVSGSDCWVRRVAVKTGFDMINAGLNGDVTLVWRRDFIVIRSRCARI